MNQFKKILIAASVTGIFSACKKDTDPIIMVPTSVGATIQLNGIAGAESGSAAANSVYQASKIYLDIYKNRKEESNRLVNFWKYDLPLTIRKHHKTVLFSFVVFTFFFIIGYFTSNRDSSLVRNIMGDDYIDMTQENIDKGNPFGVYESGNPVLSWPGIMINNIKVAVRYFVSGIFAGIPTFFDVSRFGIEVGVFDQFMASKGFGIDFWLVVFVHGMLEISAFIIVGGAGFILGKSYLFPGTISKAFLKKRERPYLKNSTRIRQTVQRKGLASACTWLKPLLKPISDRFFIRVH